MSFADEVLRRLLARADADLPQRLADRAGEDDAEDLLAERVGIVERVWIEQRGDRAGELALEPEHRRHVGDGGGQHRDRTGDRPRRPADRRRPFARVSHRLAREVRGRRVRIGQPQLLRVTPAVGGVGNQPRQNLVEIEVGTG